jgi:hypothetical protein
MDFITQYTLWTTAQAKAASVNGLTVTINDVENTVECTAAGQVFYTSTDLAEIHIALDAAIAINAILNP